MPSEIDGLPTARYTTPAAHPKCSPPRSSPDRTPTGKKAFCHPRRYLLTTPAPAGCLLSPRRPRSPQFGTPTTKEGEVDALGSAKRDALNLYAFRVSKLEEMTKGAQ